MDRTTRKDAVPDEAKQHSDTLRVGDAAPLFTLEAASFSGHFSLAESLQKGPAIVEFLRGTW